MHSVYKIVCLCLCHTNSLIGFFLISTILKEIKKPNVKETFPWCVTVTCVISLVEFYWERMVRKDAFYGIGIDDTNCCGTQTKLECRNLIG